MPAVAEVGLLTESDIGSGLRFLFLEPDVEALYNDAWSSLQRRHLT